MNLCGDGHKEVCYDELECPACKEIKARDREIVHLEEIIEGLKEKIEDCARNNPVN